MEYYRTDKGLIIKVKQNHDLLLDLVKFWDCTLGNIIKHSKNIIDLIEVGDYVNGNKVLRINDYGDFKRVDFNLDYDDGDAVYNEDIKLILTHEMYEQNCYKVGVENE